MRLFSRSSDDSDDADASPFSVEFVDSETAPTGEELTVTGADGETYAGAYLRDTIREAAAEGRLPVGYQVHSDTGVQVGSLPLDRAFVHFPVAGLTGSGKSTLLQIVQLVLAEMGHGFAAVFPKGDGDALDLVQRLPDERLSDIVWVEPASERFDRVVARNILEPPTGESQTARDAAHDGKVDAIKSLFDTSEYWGPTMEFIVETLARTMIRDDETWAPIDMQYVLATEERRQAFADRVVDPFNADAAAHLAALPDDEIRPVWKRMAKLVGSATKRPLLAARTSSIDYDRIVREGKIVLIRPPDAGDDMTAFLALMHLQEIWAAKRRLARRTDGTPPPYFIFADESDTVFSGNLPIEDMLARARSSRLGIFAACQYAALWDEEVRTAFKNNAKNKLALATDGRDSARVMMEAFREHGPDDITGMGKFRVWTKLPREHGSDAEVCLNTFPPMPPRRTPDEARAAIRENLQEYGIPELTDEDILDALPVGGDRLVTDVDADTDEDDAPDMILADDRIDALLAAAFTARAQRDADGIPIDALAALVDGGPRQLHQDCKAMEYAGPEGTALLEKDGDTATLTRRGEHRLLDQGTSGNTGTEHIDGVDTIARLLPDYGWTPTVVQQDGTAVADLHGDPALGAVDTPTQFTQQYPAAAELGTVAIEYEHTTAASKFAQVVDNLIPLLTADDHPLFVTDDVDTAAKIDRKLSADWVSWDIDRTPNDVDHRLYHRTRILRATADSDAPQVAIDGDATIQWVITDGRIQLRDSGTVLVEFDGVDGFDQRDLRNTDGLTTVSGMSPDESRKTPVKAPVLFQPGDADFSVAVLEDDRLLHFDDGEAVPFEESFGVSVGADAQENPLSEW